VSTLPYATSSRMPAKVLKAPLRDGWPHHTYCGTYPPGSSCCVVQKALLCCPILVCLYDDLKNKSAISPPKRQRTETTQRKGGCNPYGI
jgi:hypothetical protein